MSQEAELSVSEFVAVLNQTLEYAYSSVTVYGELANFRVNKNRWVYFDLKDEESKVAFFGTVYSLPGPLEEGMMLKVRGTPRLHPQYGFSMVVSAIAPMGQGTIKRLNDLLAAKLEQEGLFAPERKRFLPYPPSKIGLITSTESAAYTDFIKIIDDRWQGVDIDCLNVSVQGEQAPEELVRAVEYFSELAEPPEVIVMIRGGGSPEDLAAFSDERVTRAVAGSRVPTLVAIGHERDISLAELAADKRASTPSNAAELLVPDRKQVLADLAKVPRQLSIAVERKLDRGSDSLDQAEKSMLQFVVSRIESAGQQLNNRRSLLSALSPKNVLGRGYAIIRQKDRVIDGTALGTGDLVDVEMSRVGFRANITEIMKG